MKQQTRRALILAPVLCGALLSLTKTATLVPELGASLTIIARHRPGVGLGHIFHAPPTDTLDYLAGNVGIAPPWGAPFSPEPSEPNRRERGWFVNPNTAGIVGLDASDDDTPEPYRVSFPYSP